jgi:hypothetical protein
MAYSFSLEQIYLATEFERESRMTKRVVGTLLDSAFEGPPHDPEFDRLLARLDPEPTLH